MVSLVKYQEVFGFVIVFDYVVVDKFVKKVSKKDKKVEEEKL